jgi:flagellar motor switch protein FliM
MVMKAIKDLERGDIVETIEPVGKARVVRVSDRKLLPAIFQHYAGKSALTVDFEIIDGQHKGKKTASQHHAEEQVEVVGHA